MKKSVLSAAVLASIASAGFVTAAHADDSLTWNGITLYGTIDVDVSHQNHGAPLSQDFYTGLEYLIQKNSNKPVTSVGPNGLSQSKIGLKGKEEIMEGLNGVFNLEMGFLPTSGNLADALKSLTHNNGVPLSQQTTAADGSRAGQFFNGPAYFGLESKEWGTLTAGRHNTLLADAIGKYDPMGGSYAFSLIGFSGTTAGGGDTEDVRLDDSIKYNYKYDWLHFGALYQFGKTDSSPGEAWQADVGFDYEGFAVDGLYARKKDAISAGSLSASQVTTLPHNSLAATISDNESYTIAASYTTGPWKASGGYEHIKFENPSLPLTAPFTGLGGYDFSVVNNTAFPHPKVVEVSWIGLRYLIDKDFDITGAWYHLSQNAFGATKCSNTSAGNCSGDEDVYSLKADWRFTKRWDTYAGVMYSKVSDGLASGFLHTSVVSPTVGIRFQF
ncbi:MAG TPA: porin [Rudaea sp.]|nr:porin [Rudaea sp.]